MKYLYCAALFLAGYAQAGQLLPVRGDGADAVQEKLDEFTLPAIHTLDDSIQVEAVIESIDISGRAKRIFLGPFAGSSHIHLRIRIIDGDRVTDTLIEDEASGVKGTFLPGNDGEMLERVAVKAAEFVASYQPEQINSMLPKD
jgi:hypothetical protein